MNKGELISHVAQETGLSKTASAGAVEAVLSALATTLKRGDEVRVLGFGTFVVKKRKARKGHNPATGAEIKIAASRAVSFRPGKELRDLVNGR